MTDISILSERELVELESQIANCRYPIKDQTLLVWNAWDEKGGERKTGLAGYKKSFPLRKHDPYEDNYCMGDDLALIPPYIKEHLQLNESSIAAGTLWRMNTGRRDTNDKVIYVGDVLEGTYPIQSGMKLAVWRGVAVLPSYPTMESRVCTTRRFGGSMFTITINGYGGDAGVCGGHHNLEIIGDVFRSPSLLRKT